MGPNFILAFVLLQPKYLYDHSLHLRLRSKLPAPKGTDGLGWWSHPFLLLRNSPTSLVPPFPDISELGVVAVTYSVTIAATSTELATQLPVAASFSASTFTSSPSITSARAVTSPA